MATLNQLYDTVGAYLANNGDKEITSISTWCGETDVEYELHLHDIYDGPIGENLYTGPDSIKLYRKESDQIKASLNHDKTVEACRKLMDDLNKDSEKSMSLKQEILWEILEILESLRLIDENEGKILYCEFSLSQLEQKEEIDAMVAKIKGGCYGD